MKRNFKLPRRRECLGRILFPPALLAGFLVFCITYN